MPLLASAGCCLEQTWPYQPNPVPDNVGRTHRRSPRPKKPHNIRYRARTPSNPKRR